jgi:protein-S-isoprenylcysteine O-methyltransferase Ste14
MKKGHKRKSHEHRKDLAGEYRWGDMGQLLLLFIFIIGMSIDIFIIKISDSWQAYVPWYYRLIVFIPLLCIAGYFGQRSHKIIFEEERKKLMVINTDVYARLRHPMYFGSILTYFCFVTLSLSVIALVIFIIVIIFYYYLCRFEEQLLLEKLGDKYKLYMEKTPMLFPKIFLK